MESKLFAVEDTNLSYAWGRVFLHVMERGVNEIAPLVVQVHVSESGIPCEDMQIRRALDSALNARREDNCGAVANTMFPESLWNPGRPRADLYARYKRLLPLLKRHYLENRNGLYFERMIQYDDEQPVNQLEHVITTYCGNNHRRSALQLTVFDPHHDHTNQRQRGFPCLQSVTFSPVGEELHVTAFYPLQTLFAKAYGNYLGLCRLGHFVAHELNLDFTRLTCIAAVAKLASTKHELAGLAQQVKCVLTTVGRIQ